MSILSTLVFYFKIIDHEFQQEYYTRIERTESGPAALVAQKVYEEVKSEAGEACEVLAISEDEYLAGQTALKVVEEKDS